MEGKRTGNKRQVDVAIITCLNLYSVFTAVECKDAQVEISDVEAFVTKLQDIGAHKGVIATSVGFQDGARRTAESHGMETLIVEEKAGTMTITRSVPRFLPRVTNIALEPPGEVEPKPFTHSLSEMKISIPSCKEIPAVKLIADILNHDEPELKSWPPYMKRTLPKGSTVWLPDNTSLPVFQVCIWLSMETGLEEVVLSLPRHPFAFSIRNLISGIEKIIPASAVPVTGPRNVQVGMFYINMVGQCYYCEKVENDLMTLVLLENEQHGTTLSARMTAELRYSAFNFPIEDLKLIEKLQLALANFHEDDRVAQEKLER